MDSLNIIKVLLPSIVAFASGIIITPLLTHFLYKYKAWKKVGGKTALDGKEAVEFNKLYASTETKVPRMGGIVIWASVFLVASVFWFLATFMGSDAAKKLDFVSRSQTWIPLFVMLSGASIGLLSDLLDIGYKKRELSISVRLSIIVLLASFVGYWFYAKLGVDSVSLPFDGYLYLGVLIIPLFVLLSVFLYASGVIDGIDGLSGGVFMFIFMAYSAIAFVQNQIDLSAFCATVAGAIAAFLWFNIPPARFYMTETGSMALTLTIATVAFMTDKLGDGVGLSVLPVIAFLLFVTVLSNIIQVFSKKVFGKKVFKIAPIHHHFEAIGWPSYKVTMRYWLLGIMFAFTGVLLALIM